jgi:hypothetical protein
MGEDAWEGVSGAGEYLGSWLPSFSDDNSTETHNATGNASNSTTGGNATRLF